MQGMVLGSQGKHTTLVNENTFLKPITVFRDYKPIEMN